MINKEVVLLGAAITWIVFNVFYLPFAVWTLGLVRPWFMLNGLIPYRDFTWIRTPFDLFLLTNWYQIFGVSEHSYQLFSFSFLVLITLSVFLLSRTVLEKNYLYALAFYAVFLFPLFINTEEGELLIGLLYTLALYTTILFFKKKIFILFSISGLIAGTLLLTKQNTLPFILILPLTAIINSLLNKKTIYHISKMLIFFGIGFTVPILAVTFYFLFHNSFYDFFYYTVIFLLGSYAKEQPNLIQGDGIWIAAGFLVLLLPFVLFWKNNSLGSPIKLLLSLTLIASIFSLLPSFLSYRAFPAFPIASIIAGYNIVLLVNKQKEKTIMFKKIVSGISLLLFFILTYRFTESYINFIGQNEISPRQFITDYGDTEHLISDWIKENTDKNTAILSYRNEIIYLMTNKLPKHKYIEPFPYLLRPYEETSRVFINDPPDIVIYDTSLPEVHTNLEKWPFIIFVEENYKKVKQYEESTFIYQLPHKQGAKKDDI